MRRPAVFFDRDNTLIVGNDYLGDPAGVVLVAGAAAAIATCRNLGYAVVVVSNQSGVARGLFTEDDVAAVDAKMDDMLLAAHPGAVIDRHEYCPHHPQAKIDVYRRDCDCRKPKAGMIRSAAEAMALDVAASWVIGDAPRDVAAGRAAGCRTILVIDPTLPPSPAALAGPNDPADFTVGSLVEAVDVVAKQAARPTHRPAAGERPQTDQTRPPHAAAVTAAEPAPQPPSRPAAAVRPFVTPSIESFVNGTPDVPPAAINVPTRPPVDIAAAPKLDLSRVEFASQQILMELKKLNDSRHDDFSISKLIAGIVQTLALAALPLAYVLYRNDAATLEAWLLTAIFLQAFTVALLVMGRQR